MYEISHILNSCIHLGRSSGGCLSASMVHWLTGQTCKNLSWSCRPWSHVHGQWGQIWYLKKKKRAITLLYGTPRIAQKCYCSVFYWKCICPPATGRGITLSPGDGQVISKSDLTECLRGGPTHMATPCADLCGDQTSWPVPQGVPKFGQILECGQVPSIVSYLYLSTDKPRRT